MKFYNIVKRDDPALETDLYKVMVTLHRTRHGWDVSTLWCIEDISITDQDLSAIEAWKLAHRIARQANNTAIIIDG